MMETPPSSSSQDDAQNALSNKNLNNKYQKLAAEYAKLRSQVQVLKKAVVEEQQKAETLKSTVTSQDQSIRKLEQELDSVKFRNRQLEKRIEILQEDSAIASAASKHVQQQQLFDSNLLVHVEQNKQLQESLATLNERYNTEVGRLKRMIDHEMVPRDLLDSIKSENSERVVLLNKRIQELASQNSELRDERDAYQLERQQRESASINQGAAEVIEARAATHVELLKKLTDSELAKEKLTSEVQILKLKLKRFATAAAGTTTAAAASSFGSGAISGDHNAMLQSPTSISEMSVASSPLIEERTNMIGRLELLVPCDTTTCGNVDFELFVSHLRERVSTLVKCLQLSDSKAIHYYYEAFNLCRLLRTTQLSYKRLDSEFTKLKLKYRAAHDDLEDVKRNYNAQVDSLTEHIAILNDKLAGQVDEIVALKSSNK